MTSDLLNVMKNINSEIPEAQQSPSKISMKKATSKHIIIIMGLLKTKDKEKISKAVGEERC